MILQQNAIAFNQGQSIFAGRWPNEQMKMILSTGEMQKAAIAFYGKTGYELVNTEVADTMSSKTVGAGITRFHFEKLL